MIQHAVEKFAEATRVLRAQQDGESSTYRAFALSQDGRHHEIEADGIFVDLRDGRGLFVQLIRLRNAEGVLVFSYPIGRDDEWSQFVIHPRCTPTIRLEVETHRRDA